MLNNFEQNRKQTTKLYYTGIKNFKKLVTLVWRWVWINRTTPLYMIFIFLPVVFHLSVCLFHANFPELGWILRQTLSCSLCLPCWHGMKLLPSFSLVETSSSVQAEHLPVLFLMLTKILLPHSGSFWNILVRWMGIADLIVLLITDTEKMEKTKPNSYRFYSWIRKPLCLALPATENVWQEGYIKTNHIGI